MMEESGSVREKARELEWVKGRKEKEAERGWKWEKGRRKDSGQESDVTGTDQVAPEERIHPRHQRDNDQSTIVAVTTKRQNLFLIFENNHSKLRIFVDSRQNSS